MGAGRLSSKTFKNLLEEIEKSQGFISKRVIQRRLLLLRQMVFLSLQI